MYGKLFTSMWDGSLYGQLEASATLMACVTLCNAEGVLDMTPEAISGRTGWPLEFIRRGIEALERPDGRSRTPDDDGRRLSRLDDHRDWGWVIVNYEKYRTLSDPDTIKNQNKIRARAYRERKKERHASSRCVTPDNGLSRQAEAEAEAEKEKPPIGGKKKIGSTREPFPADFSLTEPMRDQLARRIPDADPDETFSQFRAHHESHGKRMASWSQAWVTWIGNAEKFGYPKRKATVRQWD